MSPLTTDAPEVAASSATESGSAPPSVWAKIENWFGDRGPEVPWNRTTWIALTALVALWAVRFYMTWATWGSLTIDSGREMYVPSVLAQGKTLYRDIWYLYGPAAPYLNSYLFRLFGVKLEVLYWAGSLSALGSAVLLFLSGLRLSSWLAGWTAGVVILVEAFPRWLFSFPLPYSYASVYGCLASCLFLWFAIRGIFSGNSGWVFGAGTTAAFALLLKLEFGAACYVSLVLLIAARYVQHRSWKFPARDLVMTLPGIAACAAVARWIFSLGGYEFITQENWMSWPSSYFMKNYGKMWLAQNGLSLDGHAWAGAAARTVVMAGLIILFRKILARSRSDGRRAYLGMIFVVAVVACVVSFYPDSASLEFQALFFPKAMVLYAGLAAGAAWWFFFRQRTNQRLAALAIALSVAFLVGGRMLLASTPSGYPIYYTGPAILALLLLAFAVVPRVGRSQHFAFYGELAICLMFVIAATLGSLRPSEGPLVALTTARGTIRVPAEIAAQYRVAIEFMQNAHARGEAVLSVPEDTSLYFLSGVPCPTRVFTFTPGVLAPGKMTQELIHEIDSAPVRYIIWSNRSFPEYEQPVFGRDFDQDMGSYLKSRYRFLRPLGGKSPTWDWSAGIWERKPDDKQP